MPVILLLQINFGLFATIFLFCLARNFNFNIILVGLTYLLPLIPWWLDSAHAERMLIVSYSNLIFGIIEVAFFTLTEKPEDIKLNKLIFNNFLVMFCQLLGHLSVCLLFQEPHWFQLEWQNYLLLSYCSPWVLH